MHIGTLFTAFLRRFGPFKTASKTTVKHDVFENAKNVKNTVKITKNRYGYRDLAFYLDQMHFFIKKITDSTQIASFWAAKKTR